MKKRLYIITVCLVSIILLATCQAESQPADASVPLADVTVSGWHIVVEDAMVRQSMQNVTVDLGYTDVQTNEYVKTAPAGKQFCLVKLYIEKAGSREKIEWDNMRLTDAAGREYCRTDDNFIAEMGMKRMPGTPLNFGASEGWIAFEIDEDAEGLVLLYPFEEADFTYALEVSK